MGKIYYHQSSLRIELDTKQDLTGNNSIKIKFQKESGETGEWTASTDDEAAGIIYYDFTNEELNEVGKWLFWAYVTFSDSRVAPGEPVRIEVYQEPG